MAQLTELEGDVATLSWISKHQIPFERSPGVYRSPSAWVKVSRQGVIVAAGVQEDSTTELPPEEEDTGSGCVAVFEKIQRAARTMRLLPRVAVKTRYCAWPDIIQSFFDAYGYTPARLKIVPTARQLSEMDEVIGWLSWLSRAMDADAMRIVWARAEGNSWRRIARIAGKPPNACRERFRTAVAEIYAEFMI